MSGNWRAALLWLLLAMSWQIVVPMQTAARAFQPDVELEETAQSGPRRDHARAVRAMTGASTTPVALLTALRQGTPSRVTAVQWQSIVRPRRTGIDSASDPPTAAEDH
jgi:hypothetical protein